MSIYLKLGSIEGGATEKDHDKWIEIGSMQFGTGRGIDMNVGSTTNRSATQPSISEITLSKTLAARLDFEIQSVNELGAAAPIQYEPFIAGDGKRQTDHELILLGLCAEIVKNPYAGKVTHDRGLVL